MNQHYIFGMPFAKVYPLYVQKAEGKGRTQEEVDRIIRWLTGYTPAGMQKQIRQGVDLETFFAQAPAFNPKSALITGVVCGVRVEEVPDPLMRKIRYLDKLVDELAKGKAMEKILREEAPAEKAAPKKAALRKASGKRPPRKKAASKRGR